jgi:2-polyprenyl-3-methyl-5-hydroxy-6-metoxy-1,4-benzoquinol methylase
LPDGWTDRAQAWAAHWARLGEPARAAVADGTDIAAGTRVLDAGCGPGEFCALAVSLGARVSGIDLSEGMLASPAGAPPRPTCARATSSACPTTTAPSTS